MRFSICFLLISFMVTIRPSDNFQLTEKVKAQIEEVNNKISPVANLVTSSSQTINGLLQSLQSSKAVNSIIGDSSVLNGLLANLKVQPFTPKTDANGNLECLKDSEFNFCTQDASYPKWYTELIKPEVEKTITDLPAESDVYDCGAFPATRIKCNTTFKVLEVKTARVLSNFTDKMNNSVNEFNFVLQTDSKKQLAQIGFCEPKVQKCTAGGPDQYDCKEVGPPPNFPPALQRPEDTITNYVIVINQKGLLAAARTPTTGPCFCICDADR